LVLTSPKSVHKYSLSQSNGIVKLAFNITDLKTKGSAPLNSAAYPPSSRLILEAASRADL